MGRISTPLAAAARFAAAWQSGFRKGIADAGRAAAWPWRRLFLVRLVVALWATWLIWPAIGSSLGIFGFEARDAWQRLMNTPTIERLTGSPPGAQEERTIGYDGGDMNETDEENARMGRWKEAVEQALKDANPRQGNSSNGVELTGSVESNQHHEEGAEKAQNVEKEDAEAGNEINPFASSPVTDSPRTGEINGPIHVIPLVKPEGTRFWRMRAQVRGRRRWRVRHYGWPWIFPFPMIGIRH